jgi:hypothetical protein
MRTLQEREQESQLAPDQPPLHLHVQSLSIMAPFLHARFGQ